MLTLEVNNSLFLGGLYNFFRTIGQGILWWFQPLRLSPFAGGYASIIILVTYHLIGLTPKISSDKDENSIVSELLPA